MEYKFLDRNDALVFVRADAVSATVSEHEMLLRMTFPYDAARVIESGMRVVFVDADAAGADWVRYFEVRDVCPSCIGGTVEIEADELMLAELSDSMIDEYTVDHANWATAVSDILITSLWQVGNTIPALPADTVEYDLYEITRPNASYLDLRSAPRSTSKSLGKYDNGTLVKEISNYNTDWKRVSIGGKTGYMYRPYLTFRRTVTVSGLPTITMHETYKSRWALLKAVLDKVGLRPVPRLVRSGSTLVRYVDFDLTLLDTFRGVRIEADRNVYGDRIKYSDRGLYTRVYPVGKDGLTIESVDWSVSNGDPGDSPAGYGWVEDPNATALYGRSGGYPRTAMQEFPDIEDPIELINAGWAWLQTVNYPTVSMELSVSEIGQRVFYGERVNVILQPIGALLQLNVVQLTRDLENPSDTQVTVGAFSEDSVSQAVANANEIEGVKDDVKQLKLSFLDKVYPIGSIYLSVAGTNPGTLFGGTWTQIKDRFLLAAGNTYANGSTGGATQHKHLGTSGFSSDKQGTVWGSNGYASGVTVSGYKTNTTQHSGGSTGGITVPYTGDGSSMPPYLAVYVWKRTA